MVERPSNMELALAILAKIEEHAGVSEQNPFDRMETLAATEAAIQTRNQH